MTVIVYALVVAALVVCIVGALLVLERLIDIWMEGDR